MGVCKPCVYKNLAIQMLQQNVSRRKLSERTHTGYKSMCKKLNGDTAFTIEEAIAIHRVMNKAMPIEELFSKG